MSAKLTAVTQPSPLYRLVEEKLGGPLADFVANLRATSSWLQISQAIAERTGVEVNDETLRLWFADRIKVETKVTVR